MEVSSPIILLAPAVSSAASLFILLSKGRPNFREFWTFAAASIQIALVLSLYPAIKDGHSVFFRLSEWLPGAPFIFRVDALGFCFALLSSGLWLLTSLYSLGYTRLLNEKKQTRYYFCFALSLSAAIGIAFSGDLLTFFVFYEMLTLATYPLVAHKESEESMRAGRKYLVYNLSAGAALLFAIGWIYALTGTLEFTPGGILAGITDPLTLWILFFLLVYGCGVKCALFPVHGWLLSAMAAPAPVSGLLHAVAVVKAGAFGILRVAGFVFGPALLTTTGMGNMLLLIALATIAWGAFAALAQDNLKRRLAYSTISHLSYIVMGAALGSFSGYKGAILHLSNHGVMKITLFFCAGLIYVRTHKENISDMRGLASKMPITTAAFGCAALGLAGMPLFSGFVSKWILCVGTLETGHYLSLAVLLLSGLLNMAYFAPVVLVMLQKPVGTTELIDENDLRLLIPVIAAAALVVFFGCSPWLIERQTSLASLTATQVLGKTL